MIEKEEVSKALPINQIGMDSCGKWSNLNAPDRKPVANASGDFS
jgi:hypothetical protein